MRNATILKAIEARSANSQYSEVIYDNLIAYLKEYGVKDPETMMAASPTLTKQLVDAAFSHILENPHSLKKNHLSLKFKPKKAKQQEAIVKLDETLKTLQSNQLQQNFQSIRALLYLSATAEVMINLEKNHLTDFDAAIKAHSIFLLPARLNEDNPVDFCESLEIYVDNIKVADTSIQFYNFNKMMQSDFKLDLSNIQIQQEKILLNSLEIYAFTNQLSTSDLSSQVIFSPAAQTKLDQELNYLENELNNLVGINRKDFAKQLEIRQVVYEAYELQNATTTKTVKESELRSNLSQAFDAKDVDIFIKTMKSVNYHKLTFSEKMSQDGFATAILETIKHWVESLGTPEAGSQYKKFGEHLAKVMNKEKEAAKNNGRHS